MTIGEKIKQRRKELNLSIDEVADKLNKNRATVYRYESDYIENLPITILEPLSKVLKCSPAYLMGWEEKNFSDLVNKFKKLNADGQNKVNEYISDLLENPKYTVE